MACLRSETDPDDVARVWHIGSHHLPCLFANRTAESDLRMKILARDPPPKFSQIIFFAPHGFDDNAARFLAHVNGLIEVQMSRLQDGDRNPHRCAVSPLLDYRP